MLLLIIKKNICNNGNCSIHIDEFVNNISIIYVYTNK